MGEHDLFGFISQYDRLEIDMEKISEAKVYKFFAVISFVIGYFYLKHVLINDFFEGNYIGHEYIKWHVPFFAVLFIAFTEGFAYLMGNTYAKLKEAGRSVIEPAILIGCIIIQSVAACIYGLHDDWWFYQFCIWHFTIVYYVLSRMGVLVAGRSGIFFPLDAFRGMVVIPFSNFILSAQKLFARTSHTSVRSKVKKQIAKTDIGIIIVSVIIALVVCGYAFSQLIGVSETFAALGNGITNFMVNIISIDTISDLVYSFFDDFFCYFLFSIPVGCWLYGLVAGSLGMKKDSVTDEKLEKESYHRLPSYSAYIIIGSVCVLYAIFFVSAFVDVMSGSIAATAPQASREAVGSFWQLIRVVGLNMVIMFASCFFSKKALWVESGTRFLATVLFVFALCFALLAAWNLVGVYIAVYGITPRRILSSWVVVNVISWCILILIRLYKKIPAAQIGILFAAVTFSLTVCGNF